MSSRRVVGRLPRTGYEALEGAGAVTPRRKCLPRGSCRQRVSASDLVTLGSTVREERDNPKYANSASASTTKKWGSSGHLQLLKLNR